MIKKEKALLDTYPGQEEDEAKNLASGITFIDIFFGVPFRIFLTLFISLGLVLKIVLAVFKKDK